MNVLPPRGFKDLTVEEKIFLNEIIDKIRRVFERNGFDPIETPIVEKLELVERKYGEEEKLFFKFQDRAGRWLVLRFDQTVPLARYYARFRPKLPFRRYVIDKAWRYEEPQKGRYREFYQADIDILGCKSLLADAEVVKVACEAFKEIGFKNYEIRINNRKLLDYIFRKIGIKEDKIIECFRAIDKLDKIGIEGVREELKRRGIEKIEDILNFIQMKNLDEIKETYGECEGLNELYKLFEYLEMFGIKEYKFEPSLVRGFDYYTGPIFEAWSKEFDKSLGGGGRYDNLIKMICGIDVPATGFSIGVSRILDLLFNKERRRKTLVKVFVGYVSEKYLKDAIRIAEMLRKEGLNVEIEVCGRKLKKQLEYADSKGIEYFIIVGEEVREGFIILKNLREWKEEKIKIEEIASRIL